MLLMKDTLMMAVRAISLKVQKGIAMKLDL